MNSLIFGQLTQITEPNMVSEANIYEDQNGIRYSELVTFKFKHKMVNMNRGEIYVNENKILYPTFRQLLNNRRNQYGNFTISKSVIDASWGDTIGVNKRTNQQVKINDLSQIYRIVFYSPVPTEQVVNILIANSNVEYAEGPIIAYNSISPNDPWYLDQNYRWSFNVINAETAWDITTGSPLIGIGFSDSYGGVSQLHQELVGQVVWNNLNGNYGGHGIITAGVAGALTNNGTDIASLGWNVKLLLNHNWGWSGANAVNELVLNGADVINFSWVSPSYSSSLALAIQNALLCGRVCVASAGNDEAYPPYTIPGVRYPAAYNFGSLGQVIAVSATMLTVGVEDWVTNFNYSPGTDPINDPTNAFIDCSAPGTNYRALSGSAPTGTVHIWAGTSISAPFVSALVGLMLSVNSTLTPVQIYDIIKSTTDRIGEHSYSPIGWNQWLGYGRIDAANAVNVANGSPPKPRGVNVTASPNLHPYITWESSGQNLTYKIYKKKYLGGTWSWNYLDQTTNLFYEDLTENWCPPPPTTCQNPNSIYYRLKAVNSQNKESVYSDSVLATINGAPPDKISINITKDKKLSDYCLMQNYPNPFNPITTISYSIQRNGLVTLKVFDILGTEVAELVNEVKEAGSYSVTFNASGLPGGIYFYTLTSGNFTATKKLILLK